MATIHAIQDGNWSDASTWDLNRVPDIDDDVNVLTYQISNAPDNIEVKSLTNDIGGFVLLSTSSQKQIIADIISNSADGDGIIHLYQNPQSISIIGDLKGSILKTTSLNFLATQLTSVSIVGNVELSNNQILWDRPSNSNFHYNYWRLTVNGNVICKDTSMLINTSIGNGNYEITITVNGDIDFYQNSSLGEFRFNRTAYDKCSLTFNGRVYTESENFIKSITYVLDSNVYFFSTLLIKETLGSNLNNVSNVYIYEGVKYYNRERMMSLFCPRLNVYLSNNVFLEYIGNGEPYLYAVKALSYPQEDDVRNGVVYADGLFTGKYTPNFPQEANVLKDVEYGDNQKGTLEVIALSGATATADNISVVNLTEQEVNRVKNCATVSTVQKCFEDFKEE